MNLKKAEYESINNRYAEQVLKTIKNFNTDLKFEDGMKLVSYGDSLNRLLDSDEIEVNESKFMIRKLTNEEKKTDTKHS